MSDVVPTAPAAFIRALRRSHDSLVGLVHPLDSDQLEKDSYASEWSIAQVLSHLGSGAQIFSLYLDAGLRGTEPPGREAFAPIWDVWNAKSPRAQADDALEADRAVLERFESLDSAQQQRFRVHVFGADADLGALTRMRLSEHAIHTWDVAVALDPTATVAPDAVDLLIDTLGQLAARTGKTGGKPARIHVVTSDPERQFMLDLGDAVTLATANGEEGLPELRLPAEAFLRLVYGRLDPAHTPPVEASGIDLDELRATFPGF